MAMNYEITADTTGFMRAIKGIRDEVVNTNKVIEQINKQLGKSSTAAVEVERSIDKADKSVRQLSGDVDKSAEGFGKLAKAAGAFFTLQAAQGFAQKIFAVRSEIESLQTSFRILVGDKDKADQLFQGIKEFAVSTPMQMKDLASAAQTMMGFGLPIEQLMENLKALGDVSMGDTQRFQSLALSFSQMSAAGKLMGQDLMQMINAGFNPLAIIAEKTGKSIGTLKDEMSAGAISADMVRQAFIDATSEGGKFYGMLDQQSKTLGGAFSNLQGAIDDMLNGLGEKMQGAFTAAIDSATWLAKNYETIGKIIAELVIAFGSYKAAVMAVTAYEAIMNTQYVLKIRYLRTLVTLQKLLNATMLKNPYVLAATALGSLAGALFLASKRTKEVDESTKQLNETFSKTQAEISAEQTKIDQLFEKLKKAKVGTDEYKNVKQQILDQYGEYLSGLGAEVASLKDVEGAYKAVSKAARDAALARGMEAAIKGAQDTYYSAYGENYDKIYNAISTNYGEEQAKRIMSGIRTVLQKTGKIDQKIIDQVGGLKGVKYGWLLNLSVNEQNYQRTLKNAQEKFKSEDTTKDLSKTVRDKKTIEEERKAAVAELEALSQIEAAGKKGSAIRKRISALDKELSAYDPKSDEKAAKAAASASKQQAAAARKEEQEAIRQAEAQEKIFGLKEQQSREQERAVKDLEFSTREAEIKGLEEGTEKVIRQIRLDYDREIEAIGRGMEDLRLKRVEEAKALWDADPKNKGKNFYQSDAYKNANINTDDEIRNKAALTDAARAERNKRLREQADAENTAMRSYLKQYGDYQQQRLAIEEEYQDKIDKARTEGEKLMLARQRDEELRSVDERFGLVTRAMADLFADASKKSVKAVQAIIDKYEALVKYMEGHKGSATESDLAMLGLSQEDIKNVLSGNISIKELTDRLKELKGELKDRSPYKSFTGNMKDIIKLFKDAKNASDLGNAISAMTAEISSFIPAIKEFGANVANIFGADDAKFQGIMDSLDGLMTAGGGVGQMMSGDVVGGVMNTVKGVSQMVDALDGLFGADYAEYEKMVAEYEGLIEVWDELIDKKREYINESYGVEAYQAGEEAERLLTNEIDAWRRLGRERVNSGASAGSHSIGRRIRDKMTAEDWAGVQRALGTTDLGGRLEKLYDLSSEQLQKLKEESPTFWAKMDDDMRKYLQNIIDGAEQLEEIHDAVNKQLTNTSFDAVYDSFKSSLSDMDKSAYEFSRDFEKYMFEAMLSTEIDAKFRDRIKKWYEDFAKANEDSKIDSTEMAALRSQWEELAREGVELREQIRAATGYGSSAEGSATYSATQTFTQEQGDVLNGRLSQIQMGVRQEVAIGERIVENLKDMASISANAASTNTAVIEIRNMMINTNSYLDTVARYSKATYTEVTEKLEVITNKVKEL